MFNPGDLVQFNGRSSFFTTGKIYVVSKSNEDYVYVQDPDDRIEFYFKKDFTLVKKHKKQKFHK